jgi:hypothetical protein
VSKYRNSPALCGDGTYGGDQASAKLSQKWSHTHTHTHTHTTATVINGGDRDYQESLERGFCLQYGQSKKDFWKRDSGQELKSKNYDLSRTGLPKLPVARD